MSFDIYALDGDIKVAQDYYDYLIAAKRVEDAIVFHGVYSSLKSIDHVACKGYN